MEQTFRDYRLGKLWKTQPLNNFNSLWNSLETSDNNKSNFLYIFQCDNSEAVKVFGFSLIFNTIYIEIIFGRKLFLLASNNSNRNDTFLFCFR